MSDVAGHFPLGRGKGMSSEELDQFLRESRAFANVGTLDPEGWPMVNPVWYSYLDGYLWIVTKENAGFCRNLRKDPRTTLLIANPELPYKRVIVRGIAEFVDDDWHELAREMVLRYLGPDGFAYYDATYNIPRTAVRVKPLQVTTWNGAGIDRTFFEPAKWHEVEGGLANAVREG